MIGPPLYLSDSAIPELAGSILIDGNDIQNIQLESLRRHVGLVSQDSVIVLHLQYLCWLLLIFCCNLEVNRV